MTDTATVDVDRARAAERATERIAADLAEPYTAIGEYRPAYNGHVNRETWNTALWIDNDPGTYETAREMVRDALGRDPWPSLREMLGRAPHGADDPASVRRAQLQRAGDALREWWTETWAPEMASSPLADAWTYACAVVDWSSVAEGLGEDIPSTVGAPEPDDAEDDA